MFKTTLLAMMLAIAGLPAYASDYFIVVPVKGKTFNESAISVTLAPSSLPVALAGQAYSYDFKHNLTVTGDSAFIGAGVGWTVTQGSVPAGLAVDTHGVLAGTPSAAGTYLFTLKASYRTKAGQQLYQVEVTNPFPMATNAGLTFVVPSMALQSLTATRAACGAVINGVSGWRVPTSDELGAMFGAKGAPALSAAGWPTDTGDWYWTDTAYGGGKWIVQKPYNNSASVCYDGDVCARSVCVR